MAANPALNTEQSLQKRMDAINGPIAEWFEQCTEALKQQHDQNSQYTSSNQGLQVIERKHESIPVSQRKGENMTHGGSSDSSSMMDWSSPPPEDLMVKVLQEEEGASATTAEIPGHEMGSVSQEAPTSAQPWS